MVFRRGAERLLEFVAQLGKLGFEGARFARETAALLDRDAQAIDERGEIAQGAEIDRARKPRPRRDLVEPRHDVLQIGVDHSIGGAQRFAEIIVQLGELGFEAAPIEGETGALFEG